MKHFLLILICCLLMFFHTKTNAQISANANDSTVLVEFQRAMMKEGWPALWDTSEWVMNWEGVYLDYSNGNVAWLSIHGDKLTEPFKTDSLPPVLTHLTLLDSLTNLSFTSLGLKHIPKEIQVFVDLESLSFGYNQLTTIPAEISQLTNLKSLTLNSNKLTNLPDLSDLTNLQSLSLGANSTLTELPSTVLMLKNLTRLNIHYTSITTLPEDITSLTNLNELFADATGLTSLPESIGEMTSLIDLNLSNNKLTVLPSSIGNLSNLTGIDISRNNLTELPASLNRLSALKGINFNENNLTTFPSMLASLPNIRSILGENNQMEGRVPPEIFDIPDLRLYLEGNNLSGPLAIKGNNIPERLYIKNNRFTFKDIIAHYNDFDKNNNTYIEFQPQQKIGTYRTFEPEGNKGFNLYIDNYEPAPGCEYQWYKMASVSDRYPVEVSSQDTLKFPSFDPETEGGIYYCVVTHPSLSGLSLQSNNIRVIGNNGPPSLIVKDVVFRHGSVPMLYATANDDYTPSSDLVFDFPTETAHFTLTDDRPFSYQRSVHPKSNEWTGTDTVTVAVTDEHGMRDSVQATLTVLPIENGTPAANIPPIYMNIYEDTTLPCIPGTTDCIAFYPFVSMTYLKYFVSDDFTPLEDLEYDILEADASGVIVPGKVFCTLTKRPDGVTVDATVLAYQDTVVTVTLQITDTEGGASQQTIQFVGKGAHPNRRPQIEAIPDQEIIKGTKGFPPLNLKAFTTDDYVPNDLFLWENAPALSLQTFLEDGTVTVKPAYPDSSYSASLTYYVSEKTNYYRRSSVNVTYRIMDGVIVSGSVRDGQGQALPGVALAGFPYEVNTDSEGYYEAHVLPGWEGKVYPVLESHQFMPDTVAYSNLQGSLNGQDYTGTYTGSYTISGTVKTSMGEPLAQVRLEGLPGSPLTDEEGMYTAEVPYDWEGKVYSVFENYQFMPDTVVYSNLQGPLNAQDYSGTYVGNYTISGVIKTGRDEPLAQVKLEGLPGSPLTNEKGMYRAEVPHYWEGQVAPVLEGHEFDPAVRAYTALQGNLTGEDYAARLITGLAHDGKPSTTLIAYPNPSNGEVNFGVSRHIKNSGQLIIYNTLGQECKRIALVPGISHYSWPAQGEAYGGKAVSGVYYGQLVIEGQFVETVKFIMGK